MYRILFSNNNISQIYESIYKIKLYLNAMYNYLEYLPYQDKILVFRVDIDKYIGAIEEDKEALLIDDIIYKNIEAYERYNKY